MMIMIGCPAPGLAARATVTQTVTVTQAESPARVDSESGTRLPGRPGPPSLLSLRLARAGRRRRDSAARTPGHPESESLESNTLPGYSGWHGRAHPSHMPL